MGTCKWKPFKLLVSAEEVEKEVLKIEVGKFYKTRDGRKVGPIEKGEQHDSGGPWFFKFGVNHYEKDGSSCRNGLGFNTFEEDDLISEWQDETPSPIHTVTRREIVAGKYGVVYISSANEIWIAARKHTPEELREAAHLLNQIAEVLEENGNA